MKRVLIALAAIGAALSLSACAGPLKVNGQVVARPYGLFNEDAERNPNVKYEVSAGSVLAAIIFSETVIVPVYVVGWDLFKPVG